MKNKAMKIIAIAMIICIICTAFTSCAKVIKTEERTVNAVITDTYHKDKWLQPVFNGKTTTLITHSEKNYVYIEYDGVKETINSKEAYELYKDSIGKEIPVTLRLTYYDDGNIYRELIWMSN